MHGDQCFDCCGSMEQQAANLLPVVAEDSDEAKQMMEPLHQGAVNTQKSLNQRLMGLLAHTMKITERLKA